MRVMRGSRLAAGMVVASFAACVSAPLEPEVVKLEILGRDGWVELADAEVEAPQGMVSLRNSGETAREIVPSIIQGNCDRIEPFTLGPGELASLRPHCFFSLKSMQLRIASGPYSGVALVLLPPLVTEPAFPMHTVPGMTQPMMGPHECMVSGSLQGVLPFVAETGVTATQVASVQKSDPRCELRWTLTQGSPFTIREADGLIHIDFTPTVAGIDWEAELTVTATPRFVGLPLQTILRGTSAPSCPQPGRSCAPVDRDVIYLSTFDSLYRLGPTDQTPQRVGPFRDLDDGAAVPVRDLAVLSDGRLVAAAGWLFEVDPASGWMRKLFTLGTASAIDTLPDGSLIAGHVGVSTVTTAGDITILSSTVRLSGDLAVAPDGRVFATIKNGGADELATVDPTTGEFHNIGPVGVFDVWGLAFRNGVLEGFSGRGTRIELDLNTGVARNARSFPGAWSGAAIWH